MCIKVFGEENPELKNGQSGNGSLMMANSKSTPVGYGQNGDDGYKMVTKDQKRQDDEEASRRDSKSSRKKGFDPLGLKKFQSDPPRS